MRGFFLTFAALAAAGQTESIDTGVRQAIGGFRNTFWAYAKNIDTGESYGFRPDERISTASTIKLPIMVRLFAEVEAGRARWDETLTLHEADKVGGAGVLREMSDGLKFPLRDLMRLMIVVSDNTATKLLLTRFPAGSVNQEMEHLGLREIRAIQKPPGNGTATSREMAALMEKIVKGQVVSPAASAEMIEVLKRQQYKVGIGRRLSYDDVASKHGAMDYMRSDVGVVYTKKGRVVLSVTVDGLPERDYSPENRGERLISDVTGIILEGLAR